MSSGAAQAPRGQIGYAKRQVGDKLGLRGVVDEAFGHAVFVQFAVERRTADAESTGNAGHAAAVIVDGKGDGLAFDIGEGLQVARRIEEAIRMDWATGFGAEAGRGAVDVNGCGENRGLFGGADAAAARGLGQDSAKIFDFENAASARTMAR